MPVTLKGHKDQVKAIDCNSKYAVIIPYATSCGGYNVFDRPSVSQSVSQYVSPVFLVSTTPLKPLNRIS